MGSFYVKGTVQENGQTLSLYAFGNDAAPNAIKGQTFLSGVVDGVTYSLHGYDETLVVDAQNQVAVAGLAFGTILTINGLGHEAVGSFDWDGKAGVATWDIRQKGTTTVLWAGTASGKPNSQFPKAAPPA